MSRHLLLIGGGHAQLSLLASAPRMIEAGHRVTLVSPQPVHYYSGMGPAMLGGTYEPEEIRFPIARMAERSGVRFVRDRAVRIDARERVVELAGGSRLQYDVLSVTTGSSVAPTVAIDRDLGPEGPRVFTVKPISQMLELRRLIERAERPLAITVVGGGPAAVEAAANIVRRAATTDERTRLQVDLIVGRTVLPGFPARAERIAVRALDALGVMVRYAEYVRRVTATGIETSRGRERTDVVLLATGVVPSRLFLDSRLPAGTDGSLAVNDRLQCLGHPEIYGAGDCIWFTPRPLPRAGVFAVREAPILEANVTAALYDEPGGTKRFRPQRGYLLLLNLGDDTALMWRRVLGVHLVHRGPTMWKLKDSIDRGFMREFGSEADHGSEQ